VSLRRVTVLGSTGSIGRNTLEVIEDLGLRVHGLAARKSVSLLARQAARHRPDVVALGAPDAAEAFRLECQRLGGNVPEIVVGDEGLVALAASDRADVVVAAIVGAAGLEPAHAALAAGKTVALANKEALVAAGELLKETALRTGGTIVPVDSEHSAIDQCLRAGRSEEVRRLILTASGGPFRTTPSSEFSRITPRDALRHPTWKMGPRITMDSATLMNKGFEVIEAHWLFDVPAKDIDVLIHPQSIVHSMVEYVDGSVLAQLGTTDMRGPIQYALTYPERCRASISGLDWSSLPPLEFHPPDRDRFPALTLAYQAMEAGGTAPAVLNAADEIAVGLFLEARIGFRDVPELIARVLAAHPPGPADTLEDVLEADRWARRHARSVAGSIASPSR
jgi:1-deoxy-D-xylulose-5-phosphate reductoisomerase